MPLRFREIIFEERPAFFNIRSVLTVNRKTPGLLSSCYRLLFRMIKKHFVCREFFNLQVSPEYIFILIFCLYITTAGDISTFALVSLRQRIPQNARLKHLFLEKKRSSILFFVAILASFYQLRCCI